MKQKFVIFQNYLGDICLTFMTWAVVLVHKNILKLGIIEAFFKLISKNTWKIPYYFSATIYPTTNNFLSALNTLHFSIIYTFLPKLESWHKTFKKRSWKICRKKILFKILTRTYNSYHFFIVFRALNYHFLVTFIIKSKQFFYFFIVERCLSGAVPITWSK